MKLALTMLTGGAMSGGVRKHFLTIAPKLLADPRIKRMQIFLPENSLSNIPSDWPICTWAGRSDLRRQLTDFEPDVIFIPSARFITVAGARTIIMVRNMEPLETPFFGNGLVDRAKNVARRVAAKKACARADAVIAVSNHVREFLTRRWSVPDSKIATVYHGVETPAEPLRPRNLPDLQRRSFLFSAGSIRPARGLTDLVRSMAEPGFPPDLHLVFAGKADQGAAHYEAKLHRIAQQAGITHRIHWVGQLEPASMSWCFRNCAVVVVTSRAEACPNTVLEAMRHGCLSVSTDRPPMPEFFEDTALYYSAGDHRSLVRSIQRALSLPEPEERQMRASALQRSQNFDWGVTARETLEVLLKTPK